MPEVKICCIASVDEARQAQAAGARALGLVSAMPSGPGVIGDERVAEIAAALRGQAVRTLLSHGLDHPSAYRTARAGLAASAAIRLYRAGLV